MNSTKYYTKAELIEGYRKNISTRPNVARQALLTIFAYQTNDEQKSKDVEVHNNVGFTPCDAQFLTSLALQLMRTGNLSTKQDSFVMKLMPKYSRQIAEHAISTGKVRCEGRGKYCW